MPDKNENQKHVTHAGGVKEARVDAERLNKRIQRHYDVTSDQFLKVWCGALLLGHIWYPGRWLKPPVRGEHIHHGYFKSSTDTNAQAQLNQVIRLVESSGVSAGSRVLDVGCGIGGTARYLAREQGCKVTAITNSRRQVEIARELMAAEVARMTSPSSSPPLPPGSTDFVQYPSSASSAGAGALRVLHLDVEQMLEHLGATQGETFDCIWVSEVVFHLHARQLFFDSAFALLDPGGCIVIADIFRAAHDPASSSKRTQKELASIRRNHLCPQLGTVDEYEQMAWKARFRPRHKSIDITKNVAKTW